jgi:hypothetical protein
MKRAQTLPLHVLARKAAAPKIIAPRVFLRGIADKVPSPSSFHPKLKYKAKLPQHQPCTTYLKPKHTDSGSSALPVGAQAQQSIERFKAYMLPVYDRPEFVLHHGKGSYVWDTDGNRYLDFSAGIAVNALGHADEGVLKVCVALPDYLDFIFSRSFRISHFWFLRFWFTATFRVFCVFWIFGLVKRCDKWHGASVSERGSAVKDLFFLIRALCCTLQYPFCHWFDAESRSMLNPNPWYGIPNSSINYILRKGPIFVWFYLLHIFSFARDWFTSTWPSETTAPRFWMRSCRGASHICVSPVMVHSGPIYVRVPSIIHGHKSTFSLFDCFRQ